MWVWFIEMRLLRECNERKIVYKSRIIFSLVLLFNVWRIFASHDFNVYIKDIFPTISIDSYKIIHI